MKLYKVYTKSFHAYVISNDLNEAWEKFSKFLEDQHYGYSGDREFRQIELVADSSIHCLPDNITSFTERLFV